MIEDMYDDILIVHQDPVPILFAFDSQGENALDSQGLFQP